jgi:hypothetical protein
LSIANLKGESMSRKRERLASVTPISGRREPVRGNRVGWIAGSEPDGRVRVDYEGNSMGPVPARAVVAIPPDAVDGSSRQEVLLAFEAEDPLRPIVVGLLRSPTVLEGEAWLPGPPDAVECDGRRVVLEAADEIVLRCGEASLTLRRNGQVVLKGVQVESRASGANKIRGGSVQIN